MERRKEQRGARHHYIQLFKPARPWRPQETQQAGMEKLAAAFDIFLLLFPQPLIGFREILETLDILHKVSAETEFAGAGGKSQIFGDKLRKSADLCPDV